jgi:hypothetical protein
MMKRMDFTIQEAGCLLYIADKNLGGFPFGKLTDFFGGLGGLKDLTLKGSIMATSLYQDDGYNVRVVVGDLTDEEQSEWTAKAAWKLNIESGKMVVSGVCDEDLEEYMKDFPIAENGGDYDLGCFVEIPKGEYAVTIYAYPPGDLSGGWMRIENPRLFRECFGADANLQFEKPMDYFTRTRPNEIPPAWVKDGYEEADFLNFLIHLAPLTSDLKFPEFEPDGCILWEFRKPDTCPKAIRI